jgi:hypothetical protein
MVQQDAVIAIYLMEQCGLGAKSKFKPYLDVLPQDIVPRLDTFAEDDLLFLNDKYLATLSKKSRQRLWNLYHDEQFQTILRGNVMRLPGDRNSNMPCFDFKSFHRFMTIVSSRAMVLNGRKYLTPLADMVNYQPRSEERIKSGARQIFKLYHGMNLDGSITVRADRDVNIGEQIFEDYGDLDNSLYLEAHGFVPDVNPFHCATIEGKHYLFHSTRGQVDEKVLVRVMNELGLLPSSLNGGIDHDAVHDYIPDFCIKKDGSVDNDDDALKILTIAALSTAPELLERCVAAETKDVMELECLHYINKAERRMQLVQRMARYKYCDQQDSIENDENLLQSLQSSRWKGMVSTQKMLALKFRIAEKKTLALLGNATFENCYKLTEPNEDLTGTWNLEQEAVPGLQEVSHYNDTLEQKVERFNAYINSLYLPKIKIKASYINEVMRLGVIATQDIQEGDVYLALPSKFVLDPDSFTVKETDSLAKELLQSLKANTHDGGFDALLFCLFYETFVRKENSEWYPYIQMLPTLIELKYKSPLFLQDDLYDYLAASDVRLRLVELKRSARIRFRAFSNDLNVTRLVGIENMTFEKYLWAFVIVHSRSIWWNGMRHLVPLLDLVNCAEVVGSTRSIIAPHVTQKDGDNVITRATSTYKQGDQIFENYSQPNYIYFIFHGFILDNNHKDCVLIERVGHLESPQVHTSDTTKTPSFCLHDKKSLDRFSNYLRIKYDLPGDKPGHEDVRALVMNELQRRLHLHKSISRYPFEGHAPPVMQVARAFLEDEFSNLIKLNLFLKTNFTD